MTNRSWRVDETYIRIAGRWTFLYRAVDSAEDTIDVLLSSTRDAQAAKRFFQKALRLLNHHPASGFFGFCNSLQWLGVCFSNAWASAITALRISASVNAANPTRTP